MVYLIIILLLLFLTYRYDYCQVTQGKREWLIVVTLYLIILGGLHYRVGFDTAAYERFYNNLAPISSLKYNDILNSRYAPGFVVLSSLTKQISPDLLLLNFVQSAFVCGVIAFFFNKHTKHVFFAILLFCFFMYTLLIFEQIREAISAAFFLLAFNSFVKRRWIIYYILCFCAMLFHTSATILLFIPFIALPFVRNLFVFGKKTIFICVGMFIMAFVIQAVFFKYVQLLSVTEATQELTQKYENTHYIKGNLNILGILMGLFKYVLYPFIALIFFNKIGKHRGRKFSEIEALTLLSIYISIFSLSIPIVSRFNNYFFFFPILLISDWVFEFIPIGKNRLRISYVSWMFLFLPLFAAQVYSSYFVNAGATKYKSYQMYYPYTSYLDKQKLPDREKMYVYALKHQ